jgi:hypothetical protein
MAIKVNSNGDNVTAIKVRDGGVVQNVAIGRVNVNGAIRIFWPDGDLELDTAPVITYSNSPQAALTGQPMTVSNGTWKVNNVPVIPNSFVYQWKRGTTNVGINNNYTPTISDRGGIITCTVTATYQGKIATATSNSVLVANLPGTPNAPTLTRGTRQLTVQWDPVATTGGTSLTSYAVRHRQLGTSAWTTIFFSSSTTEFQERRYIISPLGNGITYEVQVAAANAEGQGSFSASSTASTFGVPINTSIPTISFSGTLRAGTTLLTANRGAWSSDAQINSYQYLWAISSTSSFASFTYFKTETLSPTQTSTAIVPIDAGGKYIRLTVVATNSVGDSAPANSSPTDEIRFPLPPAPTNFSATAGCNAINCTWGQSLYANGYQILYGTNATNIDNNIGNTIIFGGGSTTNGQITNVNPGLYYLKIRAYNINGDFGPYSLMISPSSNVRGIPEAPTINTPTVGCNQINVTWNVPSNDNGSPITRYTLRRIGSDGSEFIENISSGTTQFSNRSVTQTGLSANFTYRYQVLARNACGDGPYSSLTTSVRPLTVPTKGSVRPVLSGSFKCGNTVSSPSGNWTNETTYRYEWQYNPGSGFNTAQINTTTQVTNNYNIPSTIVPLTTLVGSNLRTQVLGQNACGGALDANGNLDPYTSDPTGGVLIRSGDIGTLTRGPAENSGSLRRYTFTWGISVGATRYYYELRRGGVPEYATTTTARSWTSPYLTTGENWTFRVKGINGTISTGNNASDGDLIIIDGCLSGCLYGRW